MNEWMNVKDRHTQDNFYIHGAIHTNKCDEYFIRIKYTASHTYVYVCAFPACYCQFCHCFVTASKRINVGGYDRFWRKMICVALCSEARKKNGAICVWQLINWIFCYFIRKNDKTQKKPESDCHRQTDAQASWNSTKM